MRAQGLLGEVHEEIRAGELLEPRGGFGDEGRVRIEVAQALANDHVANVQGGIEPTGDAGEDDRVGPVRADEVLRRCCGVDGAHARGGGNHGKAVVVATDHGEARLVGDGAFFDGGVNLAHFFFEGADDGDNGCHATPIT